MSHEIRTPKGYQLFNNSRFMTWELVPVVALRPHEQTLAQREEEMYQKISGNQFFHKPLLVDRSTMTILDGHHRHQASLRWG